MRVIHALLSDMQGVYTTIQEGSSVVYSVISGAVLAGAITLIVTRIRRGPPLLSQPGHWLLFVAAIRTLIFMPTMIVLLTFGEQFFSSGWVFLVFGTEFLISPIAFAIATKREKTRRWRILFAILSLLTLTQSLYYFGIGLQGAVLLGPWIRIASSIAMAGNPVFASVILLVSVVERIRGQRRDWLHWAGVITHAATASLTVLQIIAP